MEGHDIHGWLLDVGTSKDGVVAWIKDASGRVHECTAPYKPTLYLLPAPGRTASMSSPGALVRCLESIDGIESACIVRRRVRLEDMHDTPVACVRARDPPSFKKLASFLSSSGNFEVFNADIPVFQKYLYETGLFPFAEAQFSVTTRQGRSFITHVNVRDRKDRLLYGYPPLKIAWLDVTPDASGAASRWRVDHPLHGASISPVDEPYARNKPARPAFCTVSVERGPGMDETGIITSLVDAVRGIDPDFILTRGGDETVFPYLSARASSLGIAHRITLSRTAHPLASECFRVENDGDGSFMSYGRVVHRSKTQYYLSGRLHVDTSIYGSLHFQDGNIPGLIEVARVSAVPIQRLNRITIGGALQSIQFQIAHDHGILVPQVKKGAETFKDVNTLLLADRGGHIFEPTTGVFDNVISLDFTSMYPMIMTRYNVSPETVNCSCCAPSLNPIPGLTGYHVCKQRTGLIPESIALPLEKRIAYKKLARGLKESGEKLEQMQAALKWILVVSFGYLGFRNARFGRVEAHQAVCAYSRELLLEASRVVQERGYDVIHGIVDSLWIRDRRGGTARNLEAEASMLCEQIEASTGLPIESDGIFRFIVFLPSVANQSVGTLNHYWGVFTDGRVKVRGIELRRHDSPPAVKAMQRDVITEMAPATSARGFVARVPRARAVLQRHVDKVVSGDVDVEDLVITMHASRRPGQYKVNNYTAIASKQLARHGIVVNAGQPVRYVITDAASQHPDARVMAWELFSRTQCKPDASKYNDLLHRAFKNMFPFPVLKSETKKKGARDTFALDRYAT